MGGGVCQATAAPSMKHTRGSQMSKELPAEFETGVHQWGERIFGLMEAASPPSLFSAKGIYRTLMDWAMKDELFKVQLFRFIDVLPALNSATEVSRHLTEYLLDERLELSAALRAALKVAGFAGGLLGGGIKAQLTGMARMFMLGDDPKVIVAILRKLHDEGAAFTVDVLGETVVSEKEADDYAARYLALLELLAREISAWPATGDAAGTTSTPDPRLNLSLKISAFYSQIHPTDPETAIAQIANRLRPVLRRAKELGAFINLDMESYALKNLTLRLFKTVFAEPEFAEGPACGLALQAYLKDSETDLQDLIAWSRDQNRRITVRLVKGAYWDYETVIARQRGWPVPVFAQKAETDANFEKLSLLLLENEDAVTAALGTHNVRSVAHALAQASRLGLDPGALEFQVLYGMAEPLKAALLQLGCRVREYCPVGELLPGMAYLVRRLLENTSNEGFLANRFAKGASKEALLRNPMTLAHVAALSPRKRETEPTTPGARGFDNEPPTDFTIRSEREKMRQALDALRGRLGRRYPLVINHRRVETPEWTPSLNPANQAEIIGYAARASVVHTDSAIAAAKAALPAWARMTADQRATCCDELAGLLQREKTALTALTILEAGKNWMEADADIAEAIDFCRFYAAMMRDLGAPHRTQSVPGETNFQHWLPRGVAVVIAPWNFPLSILTGMMSAAIVTGNTVIIKPSEQTPILAARLMELVMEAGFPAGVVNLISGRGAEVGAHLVAHPQVAFIAFTGSKEVGLNIWEVAGRTSANQPALKKVVCEMGGKNALIVDSDADLDEAVLGTLHSAFSYNGQKCSALSRLVVLADNYDRFMERLIAAAASLRIGPAEEPGTIIGPVIDRASQQRILSVIEAGRKDATVAWQGIVPKDPLACYVPPTIFTDVPPASRLFREEIFGPVLSVTRAKDFDEAIALANDSSYALTGGLYSRSPANIERAKAELICGNLYVNRGITGAIVGRQPFGGFKLSGGGTKAGGVEYLQQFMVPRVVTENCLRHGFAPSGSERIR